ncbi:two-component system, AgrA family, sensor histidine kinase AgrC [Paenibacillus uliginis N3/975]|uniref:Two-component system, AgrA family, sensor histidine kinase AgrC n=2 Tax=Paenibacillus TaxID=44249 RepID=A0A1X7HRB6_9BACL|nr:two-component system, AgrA family, sensor histidine kinase AgrC [Paenibacillus uliginis N3/975]
MLASLLFGVLNYVNFLFAMQISQIIWSDMLNIRKPMIEQIFLFAFIGVVAYLIGKLFSDHTKRNRQSMQHVFSLRQRIFVLFGNMCMVMGGIYLSLIFYRDASGMQEILLHSLLLAVYIAVIFFSHWLYTYTLKKEMEKLQMEQEVGQLEKYAASLEDVLQDMRTFKHDYANILSSLQGFIEDENYSELKRYFHHDVCTYSNKLFQINTRLSLLGHVKIAPLKGILSSKMVKAHAEQIDVFIDIAEDVHEVAMSTLDLCRIIGILLDNAIEAALETPQPRIELGIVPVKDSTLFIIKNSCSQHVPPIYKMFEYGFSTKGNNRGIGLPNVRELIDCKYPHANLNTEIDPEAMTFMQELTIKHVQHRSTKLG